MNRMVPGAVLVDGFVAATWRAAPARRQLLVEVKALERLSRAARRDVEAEGQALGRFLAPEARGVEVRIR